MPPVKSWKLQEKMWRGKCVVGLVPEARVSLESSSSGEVLPQSAPALRAPQGLWHGGQSFLKHLIQHSTQEKLLGALIINISNTE